MKLLIAFLFLSFFIGYGFGERIKMKKHVILAMAAILLAFVYFRFPQYW